MVCFDCESGLTKWGWPACPNWREEVVCGVLLERQMQPQQRVSMKRAVQVCCCFHERQQRKLLLCFSILHVRSWQKKREERSLKTVLSIPPTWCGNICMFFPICMILASGTDGKWNQAG